MRASILFFYALRGKVRDERLIKNKAVYLAIGMCASGQSDVLVIWLEQT
jgi:transposase-like protein